MEAGNPEATGAVVLAFCFMMIFYFLPTIIASQRNHHNSASIFIINMFLGWTVLGWVICLAWSVSHTRR